MQYFKFRTQPRWNFTLSSWFPVMIDDRIPRDLIDPRDQPLWILHRVDLPMDSHKHLLQDVVDMSKGADDSALISIDGGDQKRTHVGKGRDGDLLAAPGR